MQTRRARETYEPLEGQHSSKLAQVAFPKGPYKTLKGLIRSLRLKAVSALALWALRGPSGLPATAAHFLLA